MPLEKIDSPERIAGILYEHGLRDSPVWIKVNWTSSKPGMFTEPGVFTDFIGGLARPVLVLESHAVGRLKRPIAELPDDEAEYLETMRAADREFLKETGWEETLRRPGVGYLNVTEAVAAGEVAPAEMVQSVVEERFQPVRFTELYGQVPRSLFERRHEGVLINLARMKVPARDAGDWSLALKNMFGLIPMPNRMPYHHRDLVGAILDVNVIYRSVFRVIDIIEGLNSAIVYSEDGEHRVPWGRYDILPDTRLLAHGDHPVVLEQEVAQHFGRDLSDRTLHRRAIEQLGRP